MKEFEQQAAIIQQEISILRSKNVEKIKEINAEVAADAYTIFQTAIAQANEDVIESEANAYKESEDSLSLSQEELNDYIYYVTLLG
jgi:regulator of protease activity HflC (stomatin/prohibitin superfamily)